MSCGPAPYPDPNPNRTTRMFETKMFKTPLGDKKINDLLARLDHEGYEVIAMNIVGVTMFLLAKRPAERTVAP